MNWKVLVAVGALTGGVVWAALRRSRGGGIDRHLWVDATDPLTPAGGPTG